MNELQKLPMGFGMALFQNPAAARYFESLSEPERRKIVEQTHGITSKQEMQLFVSSLVGNPPASY